jgi:hypothetical protein
MQKYEALQSEKILLNLNYDKFAANSLGVGNFHVWRSHKKANNSGATEARKNKHIFGERPKYSPFGVFLQLFAN